MPSKSLFNVPVDTSRGLRLNAGAFAAGPLGEAASAGRVKQVLDQLQDYVVKRNQIQLQNEAVKKADETRVALERQLSELKKQQMTSEEFRLAAQATINQTVDTALKSSADYGPTNTPFYERQLQSLRVSATGKAAQEADARFIDEQSAIFLDQLQLLEQFAITDNPEDLRNTMSVIDYHIGNAEGTLITHKQGQKLRQGIMKRIRIAKLKQRAMNNPEFILDALSLDRIPNLTPQESLQLTQFANAQLRRLQSEADRHERLQEKQMKKGQEELALTYMMRAAQGDDISVALHTSTIVRKLGQTQFNRVFKFNEAIKKSLASGFKSDPKFLARAKAAAVTGIDPLTGTKVDEDFFINNAMGDHPLLSGTHLGETLNTFHRMRQSDQSNADSTFRRNFSQGMKTIRLAMGLSSEFDVIGRDDEEALYLATLEYTKRAEAERNTDPRDIAFEIAQKYRYALKETQFLGATHILEKLGIKSKQDILDALDRGEIRKDVADILISYFEFLDRAGKLPKPKDETQDPKDNEGGESSSIWDWNFFKLFHGSSKDVTRTPKKKVLR